MSQAQAEAKGCATLRPRTLTLCALALLLALTAAPAQAADEHAFDPKLSLSGSCTTNALDEVPDPGLCPDPEGIDHPKRFEEPCGVATDPHGDIYVAVGAAGFQGTGKGGRIDVFNPKGEYLTEVKDKFVPCVSAVDSAGHLYVAQSVGGSLVRFDPQVYPPEKGSGYEEQLPHVRDPDPLDGTGGSFTRAWAVAVDPSDDHVFAMLGAEAIELDSAANGNSFIRRIAAIPSEGGAFSGLSRGLAVDGSSHDVYLSAEGADGEPAVYRVSGSGSEAKECEIADLDSTRIGLAVDQANGDLYVDQVELANTVERYDSECHHLETLEHSFESGNVPIGAGLAVDAPFPGEVGYDSPNEGHLYVAQGKGQGEKTNTSWLYAFEPKLEVGPPAIEEQAAVEVGETEAVLAAKLSPGGLDTSYHFEYTTEASYEEVGYAGATSAPAPDAGAGSGSAFQAVSEPIAGLSPGAAYRFRLVASNCEAEGAIEGKCLTQGEGKPGEEGKDAAFATYPAQGGLPDGRAYELVTPPDTNGLTPTMSELGKNNNDGFATPLASPDGESVLFGTEGGSIPALGGGGFHDTYEALRTPQGWSSHFTGLSAAQSAEPYAGGVSADHRYSFWWAESEAGELAVGNYLRSPDGAIEPIGIGDFGEDLEAKGRWISAEGEHVIFETGSGAIYDRGPGEPTVPLSILPGESTPSKGSYEGASSEGTAVAFAVAGTLYLRLEETEETQEVAAGKPIFAGIAADGERVTYLRPNPTEPNRPNPAEPEAQGVPQGEIFSYDAETEATEQAPGGDESVVVNVSADGSHIYFVSPEELNGGGEGEEGGGENLYLWDLATPGSARFIGALTQRDVEGEPANRASTTMTHGLGLWVKYVVSKQSYLRGPGAVPSRSTPDGRFLLFESRARLSDYENAGHAEVYRFDAAAAPGEALQCISCNPSGEAAAFDAELQGTPGGQFDSTPPYDNLALIANLAPDGRRAFFESADRLAAADVDMRQDVYEWEAQGVGSCESAAQAGGCIYLISGGRSGGDDYLYSASADGKDVFFETYDVLVAQDPSAVPSIYDARAPHAPGEAVGFPAPPSPPSGCQGEACQPLAGGPAEAFFATSRLQGPGNPVFEPSSRCPQGRHPVRRHGKTRCAPKRHKHARGHKRKHRSGHARKGGVVR